MAYTCRPVLSGLATVEALGVEALGVEALGVE
jgi:hypothetical protein